MNVKSNREIVVLVHGILSGPIWMVLLDRRIKESGFATRNWGYRSWLGGIEPHAQRLVESLRSLEKAHSKIHIVAHSMGSIVTRVALLHHPIQNLGQVVFLTPPHQGSKVARLVGPMFRWICPAASQLSDHTGSYVCNLPSPDYPFGVVSADYDLLVAAKSTHLENCKDRIAVKTMHNGVLFSKLVSRQTIHYLQHGSFLPKA